MAGRLLYGYRRAGRAGAIRVDPLAAAVVCAVLAVPPCRGRYGLAPRLARRLLADITSPSALARRLARIRAHAEDYRLGRARRDLAPCSALILSGPARRRS